MQTCETCGNAIFDSIWGQYKCGKRKRTVNIVMDADECKYYKKGEPKPSAESKLYDEENSDS